MFDVRLAPASSICDGWTFHVCENVGAVLFSRAYTESLASIIISRQYSIWNGGRYS